MTSVYQGNPYYAPQPSSPSSGGGFLASQGGQPTSPAFGSKSNLPAARPVTIMQVNRCKQAHNDADFVIDDGVVQNVTLVARIIARKDRDTSFIFQLEDTTGEIECRLWTSAEEKSVGTFDGLHENAYVRVLGTIKTFNNRRTINATAIRAIEDPHEIFFHDMDVVKAHLLYTRGPAALPPHSNDMGPINASSTNNYNFTNTNNSYTQEPSTTSHWSRLPLIQRAICEYLSTAPGRQGSGTDIKQIVNGLKTNNTKLTADDISDALEALMESGLIFNTGDEVHYDLVD